MTRVHYSWNRAALYLGHGDPGMEGDRLADERDRLDDGRGARASATPPNEGLEGGLAMEERSDESFRFMEELVTTWLEGAHDAEIARVLDRIKAELDRRGAPIPPGGSSSG